MWLRSAWVAPVCLYLVQCISRRVCSLVLHYFLSMAKVKIRANNNSSELKGKLLQLLVTHSVRATKLLPVSDGFVCFCASPVDADQIFAAETYSSLITGDFEPVMPQQLRALRTILLHILDDYIVQHTSKEMELEIASSNRWCVVKEVIKIPNSKLVKVVLQSSEMSDKCTKKGLLMFNLYVPPSSISRDEYHPIQTCYRGYRVDDHTTTLCPQPSSYTICSLCASRDHNWKYCNSKKRKCCNCNGDHSTLSMSCFIRKSVV